MRCLESNGVENMRILFLNAYFYPEEIASSYLGHNIREAFVKSGSSIVLFAPVPSRGVSDEIRRVYGTGKKDEAWYDGKMIIHRFPMYQESRSALSRAFRYVLLVTKLLNRGLFSRDAKECDVQFIPSTPPIMGIMASIIKFFTKKPFIYCLQDVFPDSLVGTGMTHKGSILWKIGRVVENITYRNADRIIVISADFKRNIMAKGVLESKIEVIYNWVDANAVRPVNKEDNPLFGEFNLNKELFTVVYAGNLGNAQNIDIILSAAYLLPQIQFSIFGKGGQEEEIRNRITKESLNNVHLLPLQPMERVSYVYSLGDACIVSCKAGLGGSAMPSKTWSIMSCGRPVIANFDEGELKDILEDNDCGVFSHAGDVQEFVDAIKVLADNHARCEEMGRNARQFILDNLTKEVGTQKYVDVIKQFEKQ